MGVLGRLTPLLLNKSGENLNQVKTFILFPPKLRNKNNGDQSVISEKKYGSRFTSIVTYYITISSTSTRVTSLLQEGFTQLLPFNLYNNLCYSLILLFILKNVRCADGYMYILKSDSS